MTGLRFLGLWSKYLPTGLSPQYLHFSFSPILYIPANNCHQQYTVCLHFYQEQLLLLRSSHYLAVALFCSPLTISVVNICSCGCQLFVSLIWRNISSCSLNQHGILGVVVVVVVGICLTIVGIKPRVLFMLDKCYALKLYIH